MISELNNSLLANYHFGQMANLNFNLAKIFINKKLLNFRVQDIKLIQMLQKSGSWYQDSKHRLYFSASSKSQHYRIVGFNSNHFFKVFYITSLLFLSLQNDTFQMRKNLPRLIPKGTLMLGLRINLKAKTTFYQTQISNFTTTSTT